MTGWNPGTGMPSCWVISLGIIDNHYLSAIRLHTAFSIQAWWDWKALGKVVFEPVTVAMSVRACKPTKSRISATGHLSNAYKSRKRAWYKTVRALFQCKSWKKNMKHEPISWVSKYLKYLVIVCTIVLHDISLTRPTLVTAKGPYISWNN